MAGKVPAGLSAIKVDPQAAGEFAKEHEGRESWNIFNHPKNIADLNAGKTVFKLLCRVGTDLTDDDKRVIRSMVNLSSFQNEEEENNTPIIDVDDEEQNAAYTIIITKTCYLIPGVGLSRWDDMKKLMSKTQYHKLCQPGSPVFLDLDPDMPQEERAATIRFTKTIVPVVLAITMQLKMTELTQEQMMELAMIDGFPAQRAILMERTKRHLGHVDTTRKVKSIVLYNDIPGGMLMRHIVVVHNTAIPKHVGALLETMSGFGCKEAYQTAQMTRHALPQLLEELAKGKNGDINKVKPQYVAGWFY